MKSLVCVLLLVGLVAAETPLFRPPSRTQRLEFRRDAEDASSKEPTTEKAAEAIPKNVDNKVGGAPYPAAGFRPLVPFSLPPRVQASPSGAEHALPSDSYGPPLFSFVGPPSWYGAPANAEEKPEEPKLEEAEPTTTTEEPTTAKPEKTTTAAATTERATGAYYVLLPGPQLQRIVFMTESDVTNMAYTAQIQYKSEDRGPILVYSPAPAAAPEPQYAPPPSAAYTTYQLAPVPTSNGDRVLFMLK